MKWLEAMYAELDEMTEVEQITATGEWIVRITQEVLPALGARRRDMLLNVLDQPDWDYTRLAESIGSRRTAIVRLAEEGRARKRERGAQTP
jgi:hypothetical protein